MDQSYERLDKDRNFHKGVYEEQVMQGEPAIAAKYKTSLTILNNEIVEAEYKSNHIIPIVLEGDAKLEHDNKWRTYSESIANLEKQHRQLFYMIRYQCMQVLLDNMKHDPDWDTKSKSYDPLTLITLIEKKTGSDRRSILICKSVQSIV